MSTAIRRIFDMDADKCKFRGVGFTFTATAGATTSGQYKLTGNRLIDGTQLLVNGGAFGDYISFQVVDVDNVLGYGAGVVLDTFGSNWYIASDKVDQGHLRMVYSAEIFSGLYIRVNYTSVGATNVGVVCNLFVHEYLA